MAPLPKSRTDSRVIRACAPDLVLVQEAPRFFRWRKKLARLARAADLLILSGGAPAAGPALLCNLRTTVEHTEDVLLPLTPGRHRRGLSTAVVRYGAARLGVVSCHLSLDKAERYEQSGMLLDRLAALDAPHAIAGGDINERPSGRTFQRLAQQLQDCHAVAPWGSPHSWIRDEPHRRIDAIFATKGVEVLGCGVPVDQPGVTAEDLRAATDHLPVLAALRIPPG
jgi:endonuclease/exonuclease/phosphatase family metal-dependent hydrolase